MPEPPKLVVEKSKVSLFEGNEVLLACQLQGTYLGSEVFWYNNKNQVIRPDAKKYRLQKENAWFNLTLQDTEWMKDSGIYRCAAMNAVGNASALVSLQVKKYPTPPNVTISKLMYTRHRTEVELEWQTQGSGNLTGFVVQRSIAKKATKKQLTSFWETVANDIDPDIRDQKLGGLDPAVVYAFRILAVNHRTTGHPSEVKTPDLVRTAIGHASDADPPFNAYPAVIGAAAAGMIVATVTSLLVFQYILRNRENNPRLHDLLFRMAGAEAREHISTPEDAETAMGLEGEAGEQVGEPSTTAAGETSAEVSPEEATRGPEHPAASQEDASAPGQAPEPTADDAPVNVTITVMATP
ncbi:hypothetical protein JD844_031321 [Phrynosoma platyrhinos]|uniref:Uncharacterized protein n=1 Tax=Phrynosoma platyrhinos TaxID=52577 RepID=A0ABQ7T1A3_PHRPL|nr:hypothetical protein JD844_031321 [Phrynosoma platyrhinos]